MTIGVILAVVLGVALLLVVYRLDDPDVPVTVRAFTFRMCAVVAVLVPPTEPTLVAVPSGSARPDAVPSVDAPSAGIFWPDPRPRGVPGRRLLGLSRLEYDLLLSLAENPRQVFTRAQLLAKVWGHVHVSRLRTKPDSPDVITTVYGVGRSAGRQRPDPIGRVIGPE